MERVAHFGIVLFDQLVTTFFQFLIQDSTWVLSVRCVCCDVDASICSHEQKTSPQVISLSGLDVFTDNETLHSCDFYKSKAKSQQEFLLNMAVQ